MSEVVLQKTVKKPRKTAALQPVSADELKVAALELVRVRPGVSGADLKKMLPVPMKKQAPEALELLRSVALEGHIFAHSKGKKERFFADDPVATLDRLVPAILRAEGPLLDATLKNAVTAVAPGYVDLLPEWRKSALGRRLVFEHGPSASGSAKTKGGKKRLSAEPDFSRLLAKTLKELRQVLSQVEPAGVGPERLLDVIRRELGLQGGPSFAASVLLSPASLSHSASVSDSAFVGAPSDEATVLSALLQFASEHRPGTLLLAADVRKRTSLDKARFDIAAVALSRDRKVVLHHHDHPAALPDTERDLLVSDGRGTFYIGIAPRTDA